MVTDYICQSVKLCGYIKSAPSTRKGPICFVIVIVTYFTIKVTNTQKNPFQNIVSFNKTPKRLGIMIYALRWDYANNNIIDFFLRGNSVSQVKRQVKDAMFYCNNYSLQNLELCLKLKHLLHAKRQHECLIVHTAHTYSVFKHFVLHCMQF